MLYEMIFDILHVRLNTPYKMLPHEPKVESLSFDEFMACHKIQDEKKYIYAEWISIFITSYHSL